MSLFILTFLLGFSHAAPAAMTVDDVIKRSEDNSEVAKAAQKTVESIRLEIKARDLVLGWELNGEASSVHDNRDQVTFAQRSRYDDITFTLQKLFSTGTTFSLNGSHDNSQYTTLGQRNNEGWEVRLTQSLWRDAFGHNTHLRWEGEKAELVSRQAQAYYNLENFYVTVESLYWDLSVAIRQQEVRKKNIENGERLLYWTRERAKNSAAEASDVYQAEALVSQAKLDAINAQNSIDTLKNQLRTYLPNLRSEDIVIDENSLGKIRSVDNLIVKEGSGEPRRLDTISAVYLANQAEATARQVKDSYRPRVDAYVGYGQNGIAPGFSNAWDRSLDSDHNITRVGVQLSIDLSRGLVSDRVRSAELAAEAQRLNAQTQSRTSTLSWDDLRRQVNVLKQRLDEATHLADLQNHKVIEERKRFRLGRSTVFQLVTYELDVANAELTMYQSMADLRKAESQARYFTTMQGS